MQNGQKASPPLPLSPEKWWEWFATRPEEDKDRMVEEALLRVKERVAP